MESATAAPPSYIALGIAIAVMLSLSAFLSGSETAIFSLSRSSVARMRGGSRAHRRVASLLAQPRMLLVTILFGNLLVNVASTSFVTALAMRTYGEAGIGYAMLAMTCLILVFGEITPKSIAIRHAPALSVAVAPVIRGMMIVFYPIRFVLGRIADSAVNMCRRLFGESREEYGVPELTTAVEMGRREGLFDEFESRILTNLFLLSETSVREILTPRVDVFSLDVETPVPEALRQVRSRGFTRVPLYEGRPENIVGVLHAKDLLGHARDERITVGALVRTARFVPETKKIRELLGELIAARQHMVIALDEHGSCEGIATLEDILEEIFGEIQDEYDQDAPVVRKVGPNEYVLDARVPLEELENDVKSTGFYRNKAKSIQGCCRALLDQHGGQVPRDFDALLGLPGIGRKTANVILGAAFGIASGIVVDTHVARLSRRLGLSRQKDPNKIEQDLTAQIPKKEWIDFGHRMIQHGRRVCTARKPQCEGCPLESFCPRVGVAGV